MHVLIICLSSRKAGFDGIGQTVQSMMVALTLNKPYNFSKYVFLSMCSNIHARPHRFLMFPHFIQLFLNAQAPNLPTDGRLMRLTRMQKSIFADCRQYGRNPPPPEVPLFGHIVNQAYVEPARITGRMM